MARESSIDPDPTFIDFGDIDFEDAPATERNPSPPDGCEGGPISVTKLGGYTKPIANRVQLARPQPARPEPARASSLPVPAPVPVPVPVPVLPLCMSSPPSERPLSLPPVLPALIIPAEPSALIGYEGELDYGSSVDPVILPFASPFAWAHRWSEHAVALALALGSAIERRLSGP